MIRFNLYAKKKTTYFLRNYYIISVNVISYIQIDCCRAMVVDGHMKGTRLVCDYSEGEIECEEIGSVKVGCKKTPIKLLFIIV